MLDQTLTSLNVNDMRISEQLAKAERYHDLTRADSVSVKKSVQRPAVQTPGISLISRLFRALPRPA
jgi:hypothetical protein